MIKILMILEMYFFNVAVILEAMMTIWAEIKMITMVRPSDKITSVLWDKQSQLLANHSQPDPNRKLRPITAKARTEFRSSCDSQWPHIFAGSSEQAI